MTSFMQPTGVYPNLYVRPATSYPSAPAQATVPSQSSVQQNASSAQTQAEPASAEFKKPKKKSHWVFAAVLAVCAVAAGLFIGMPALGKALDTSKAKKFVEATPLNFLKPALRAAREGIVSFGNKMDAKVKNFQQAAKNSFDYLEKWRKQAEKPTPAPETPEALVSQSPVSI